MMIYAFFFFKGSNLTDVTREGKWCESEQFPDTYKSEYSQKIKHEQVLTVRTGVLFKNIYIHEIPLTSDPSNPSEFNVFSLLTTFGNNKNIFSEDCTSSWSFLW